MSTNQSNPHQTYATPPLQKKRAGPSSHRSPPSRDSGHSTANSKRRKFSSESDSDDQKPARGSPGKKKAAPSPKSDGQSPTLVLQPEAVVPPPTLAPRPPSLQPPPDSPTIQTDLEPAATEGPTPHALIGDVPAVVPAPVVTNTTAPTLSSGARKGLEQAPTEVPSLTVTESTPPSSMSALPDRVETARPEPARNDNRHKIEGNLHSSTENALIAVGSIGATIITFFIFWLAWRCFKIHKRKRGVGPTGRTPTLAPSLDKPKQLLVGLASRIPVLRERVGKRSWANIDKPYGEAYWEKTFPVSNESPQGGGKGIHVRTAVTTRSGHEGQSNLSLTRQAPQQPTALKTGTRSRHHMSGISDISSLSSGFGDGDIIMPPAHGTAYSTATTTTAEPLAVPAPVAQRASISDVSQRRETVYTEASEDPLPRFRTINSWVRQQSGRIKRANQRDMTASDAPPVPSMPPEQDFRLMMPDEEEPRRVEEGAS
ncbi:hypothetical protein G6O67_001363 [Ophiocordyceps sinensis]|uniref:Uncharacterized protein n=1 Tax=Ophiocordyceps sinensis TaxID=72228 RepID=A0A8H4PXC3_9HYPO|nr:hypothetical protein G6O67_001363 [Ophiocordyceps sinensis]